MYSVSTLISNNLKTKTYNIIRYDSGEIELFTKLLSGFGLCAPHLYTKDVYLQVSQLISEPLLPFSTEFNVISTI